MALPDALAPASNRAPPHDRPEDWAATPSGTPPTRGGRVPPSMGADPAWGRYFSRGAMAPPQEGAGPALRGGAPGGLWGSSAALCRGADPAGERGACKGGPGNRVPPCDSAGRDWPPGGRSGALLGSYIPLQRGADPPGGAGGKFVGPCMLAGGCIPTPCPLACRACPIPAS